MRFVIEKQENVSYVFLGSKTHVLARMFASKSRPFYNSAQKFLLRRLIADSTVERVDDGYVLGDPLLAYHLVQRR